MDTGNDTAGGRERGITMGGRVVPTLFQFHISLFILKSKKLTERCRQVVVENYRSKKNITDFLWGLPKKPSQVRWEGGGRCQSNELQGEPARRRIWGSASRTNLDPPPPGTSEPDLWTKGPENHLLKTTFYKTTFFWQPRYVRNTMVLQ